MKQLFLLGVLCLVGCTSVTVSKDIPRLKVGYVEGVSSNSGDIKVGIVRNKSFGAAAIHYWPIYVSG
jgi:hypothetical protein